MLLKVLLVTAVIFSISATAAAAPSICRELPSGTQTAGNTISVDLVVSLDGESSYLLGDTVPAGWEIVNAPGSAGISLDKRTVTYAKLGTGSDTTLTYTVKIPAGTSAGTYPFNGEYGIGSDPTTTIGCTDLSVTVGVAPPSGDAEVCRNLPSGAQSAGSTISVDLVVTMNGADSYLILDRVPAGWEIVNAPDGMISGDKETVSYAALGTGSDTTLTYMVKIPDDASAGTYTFSGEYGIGTDPTTSISCTDLSVTVGEGPDPQPSNASVCRNIPGGAQSAGSTISVDLVVTMNGADSYLILDRVPAGWEIVNAPDGMISGDKETVSYAALGTGSDTTLTYMVKIPDDASAGTYTFSGEYGIGTDPTTSIVCNDLSATVGEPITGIHLQNGWNLFSVPCVLDDDSRAHVLEGVDYEAIIWFDASAQQWKDDPATIEPLTAYAIQVNNTTQQVITNIECTDLPIVPPSRHMYPGWNLVGLTSYDTKTAESAFIAGGIDDSYSRVWGPWNAVDRELEQLVYNRNFLDPGAGYLYTEDYIMRPYKGQWIFMEQEDTLIAIGP